MPQYNRAIDPKENANIKSIIHKQLLLNGMIIVLIAGDRGNSFQNTKSVK